MTLCNATVVDDQWGRDAAFRICYETVEAVTEGASRDGTVLHFDRVYVTPRLIDAHVHLMADLGYATP